MASEKIIRTINIGPEGVVVFAPEDGRPDPDPVNIRPDKSGQQWYWTPEDAALEP